MGEKGGGEGGEVKGCRKDRRGKEGRGRGERTGEGKVGFIGMPSHLKLDT